MVLQMTLTTSLIDQVRNLKEENLFLKEKLGEANKKLNTYKQVFVKELREGKNS